MDMQAIQWLAAQFEFRSGSLHSLSYKYPYKKYESISSPFSCELNSREDWALQPWLKTCQGDGQLWIQN